MVVDIQLRIMYYKDELVKDPNNLALKALLKSNRQQLKDMK